MQGDTAISRIILHLGCIILHLHGIKREIPKTMNIIEKLKTTAYLLWNKGVAIIVLILLLWKWANLGKSGTPFAEIIYALILISTIIVCAPVVRLLVFPEAAGDAEKGRVEKWLTGSGSAFTPALVHYWIATVISYAVTALCVSSLL